MILNSNLFTVSKYIKGEKKDLSIYSFKVKHHLIKSNGDGFPLPRKVFYGVFFKDIYNEDEKHLDEL